MKKVKEEVFVSISPINLSAILDKIPIEDYSLFLLNSEKTRPIDLILTHLVIPPVCIRPTVPLQ